MAKKSSSVARPEREGAVDHPKRDLKETDNGLSERLEAAKGGFASAQSFTKDTIAELKKVQWPTRRQAALETVVVLCTVALTVIMVMFYDWAISLVADRIFTP